MPKMAVLATATKMVLQIWAWTSYTLCPRRSPRQCYKDGVTVFSMDGLYSMPMTESSSLLQRWRQSFGYGRLRLYAQDGVLVIAAKMASQFWGMDGLESMAKRSPRHCYKDGVTVFSMDSLDSMPKTESSSPLQRWRHSFRTLSVTT